MCLFIFRCSAAAAAATVTAAAVVAAAAVVVAAAADDDETTATASATAETADETAAIAEAALQYLQSARIRTRHISIVGFFSKNVNLKLGEHCHAFVLRGK